VAFGLLALLLLGSGTASVGRIIAGSAALLASLMCSGAGLAFFAAAAVELAFDPRARRRLIALVVPAMAFAAWFLEYGSGLAGTPGAPCSAGCERVGFSADVYKGPITVSYIVDGVHFVAVGFEGAIAAMAGATVVGSLLLVAFGALLAIEWYWAGRFESWQIGLLAGAATWYGFIYLGRGKAGPLFATESHYVYVGVALLLPLLAHVLRYLPWRGLWRPALAAAFAAAAISNAIQLSNLALSQVDTMHIEDAELQTVFAFRGAPDMALDQPLDSVIMPQLDARELYAATEELGYPVTPVTSDALRQLPPAAVDGEMSNLFLHALTVAPEPPIPAGAGQCQSLPVDGKGFAVIEVPNAGTIDIASSSPTHFGFTLGWLSPPPPAPVPPNALDVSTTERVHLPDAGKPIVWQLGITVSATAVLRACQAPSA